MEALPPLTHFTGDPRRRPWDKSNRTRYTRTISSRPQAAKEAVLNNLKTCLQPYGMAGDLERLSRNVITMTGVENMNMDYLAAAIYLYRTYQEAYSSKGGGTTADMFVDSTSPMKKIAIRLNSVYKNPDEKKIWPTRKVNILTYLETIVGYLQENNTKFESSSAYNKRKLKEAKEKAKEKDEASEEVDEEEDELADETPDDFDDYTDSTAEEEEQEQEDEHEGSSSSS